MPWRAVVQINSPFVNGIGTNTWHARFVNGTPGPEQDLANAIRDFYVGCQDVFALPCTFSFSGQWQGVGPDQGEVKEGGAFTIAPSGAAAPLPLAIAQVVTWRTSLNTRSGRGRTFLGPIRASTLQDNGTPSEAAREDIQSAANTTIAASAGYGAGALGVWSPTDQVFRDFVAAAVPNEYAVLRSRRD